MHATGEYYEVLSGDLCVDIAPPALTCKIQQHLLPSTTTVYKE